MGQKVRSNCGAHRLVALSHCGSKKRPFAWWLQKRRLAIYEHACDSLEILGLCLVSNESSIHCAAPLSKRLIDPKLGVRVFGVFWTVYFESSAGCTTSPITLLTCLGGYCRRVATKKMPVTLWQQNRLVYTAPAGYIVAAKQIAPKGGLHYVTKKKRVAASPHKGCWRPTARGRETACPNDCRSKTTGCVLPMKNPRTTMQPTVWLPHGIPRHISSTAHHPYPSADQQEGACIKTTVGTPLHQRTTEYRQRGVVCASGCAHAVPVSALARNPQTMAICLTETPAPHRVSAMAHGAPP